MNATLDAFRVAAVQAAPIFLERDATVAKACALVAEAAAQGARLVVLPETFVPAYPAWVWFLPLTRRADLAELYRALVENSIDVPGPETERLGKAAADASVWLAIGVNERNTGASATTLYNTLLLFDDRGTLVERRRKLMPTGGERLVWAPGEAVAPRVHATPLGRLGGLICWENYMPLARYALYCQGLQIHLAPTWDKSEMWIASMRHIAREGRVFVIGCCQALHRDQVPDRWRFKDALPADLAWLNVGNSVIVDPDGAILAGPLAEREGILVADVEPGRTSGSRWIFDAAGHYDRPDVFRFTMRGEDGAFTAPAAAAIPSAGRRRSPKQSASSRARPARVAAGRRNGAPRNRRTASARTRPRRRP